MDTSGRSPRPPKGDPNAKTLRLLLTPDEWRKLRYWAAQEDKSVQAIVAEIVRRTLAGKPTRGY